MKKTTLIIAAAFFTFTVFSQTNTASGNNQGTQNQTNQTNRGNQNNQNNVPQQNPTGQDNNVNKSDWNNQKGQSEQTNQKNQHQTQTGQGQTQNQNQSDFKTGGGMPPTVVTNRFTTDYPGMQPTWTTDHVNNYRASYKDAGSNSSRSVTYDKNGNVISRDMELGDNDYPTGIRDYFTKNKMNNKHSVWSSEDKDGNKIYYSSYDNKTYWFDKDGKYQDNKGSGTKDKNSKNNNSKQADKTAPKKDKSTNKEMRKDPQ